jgi:hypothetical protein
MTISTLESARTLGVSADAVARRNWSPTLRARVERLEAAAAGARAHVLDLTARQRELADERERAVRTASTFDRQSQAELRPFLDNVEEELTRLGALIADAQANWQARAAVVERVLRYLRERDPQRLIVTDGGPLAGGDRARL